MVCKGIAGISNYLILTALTHTLWEISRTKSIKLNTAHMLFIKFEKKKPKVDTRTTVGTP